MKFLRAGVQEQARGDESRGRSECFKLEVWLDRQGAVVGPSNRGRRSAERWAAFGCHTQSTMENLPERRLRLDDWKARCTSSSRRADISWFIESVGEVMSVVAGWLVGSRMGVGAVGAGQ